MIIIGTMSIMALAVGFYIYKQKMKKAREEKKKAMLQRLNTLLKSNPKNEEQNN